MYPKPALLQKARETYRKRLPNDAVGRAWDEIVSLVKREYSPDSKVTITWGGESIQLFGYFILMLDRVLAEYECQRLFEERRLSTNPPPLPKPPKNFDGDIQRAMIKTLEYMPWVNFAMTTWPCRQLCRDDFLEHAARQVVDMLVAAKGKAVAKAEEPPDRGQIEEVAYLAWEAAGRPEGDGRDFWLAAEARIKVEKMRKALWEVIPRDDDRRF